MIARTRELKLAEGGSADSATDELETMDELDRELSRAFRERAVAPGDAGPTHEASCPDLETIAAAVLEEGAPHDAEVLEHARTCGRCAAEVELARSFAAAAVAGSDLEEHRVRMVTDSLVSPVFAADRAETRRGRFRGSRSAWVGLVAAVVLLMIGVTWSARRPGPPTLPERSGEQVVRTTMVGGLEPSGELSELPERFVWRPVEGANGYRVTVTRVDGEIVLEIAAGNNFLVTDAAFRQRLEPRVRYRWQVTALAAGAELARSPFESFVVVGETTATSGQVPR